MAVDKPCNGTILEVNTNPEIKDVRVTARSSALSNLRAVTTASKILLEYLEDRPRNSETLLFSSDEGGVTHLRESTIRNQVNLARKRFGLKESFHRLCDYSLTLYAQQGATFAGDNGEGRALVQVAMAYQRDAGTVAI